MINYLNSDNELCDLVDSPEYRRTLLFFLLSYLVRSQIWLNYFLDDRHFGYITKIIKRDPSWGYRYPKCGARLGDGLILGPCFGNDLNLGLLTYTQNSHPDTQIFAPVLGSKPSIFLVGESIEMLLWSRSKP